MAPTRALLALVGLASMGAALGFRPSPGRLEVFDFPLDRGPGRVRLDTHLAAGETSA